MLEVLALGIVAISLLIGISAFFSSSEIAIFSFDRHRVDALAAVGSASGRAQGGLRDDPPRLLVTALAGNNVENIAAASVVTALLLGPLGLSSGSAVTDGTLATSVFVLVLGEIAPKSYAVSHSESWSLRVARPLALVQRVASPIVYVFGAMTDVVNRFTGGRSEFDGYLTCDDIEAIVTAGAAAGVLDPEEEEMLQAVFDLGELPVTAAMVPWTNVIGVSIDASLREVRLTLLEHDLSRVPVYGDSQDDVRGVVRLRDALHASDRGQPIREVLAPTLFVPETKPLDELLAKLQENRVEGDRHRRERRRADRRPSNPAHQGRASGSSRRIRRCSGD